MDKVLFIDDEPRVLHSLKLALYKESYQLFFANGASEALKILQKENISVVVSDHKMPGTCGVELLNQIKRISPYTIRILLTGECDYQNTIASINEAQVYMFLQKPFNSQDLKKVMTKAINMHHQQKLIGEVSGDQKEMISIIQHFSISHTEMQSDFLMSDRLTAGMTLDGDLHTDTGVLLMRKGHILTSRDLLAIKGYQISEKIPVAY